MPAPLRTPLSVVLAATIGATATAQDQQESLSQRIERAVREQNYADLLSQAGVRDRPIGELVDAVVPLRQRLRGHLWARAIGPIRSRGRELDELWRADTTQRRARAAVLADVMGGWVERYVAARGAERGDIEAVARHLHAQAWAEKWQYNDSERWAAEQALQRIRAAAERERGAEIATLLRDLQANSPGARILGGSTEVAGVFGLCDALVAADEATRLRAAIALRLRLSLEMPAWLVERARDDVAFRRAIGNRVRFPRADEGPGALERLIADLDADRDFPGWVTVGELDGPQRWRLAKALISYALRVPVPSWDEMVEDMPRRRARDAADARASGALAFAASLGTSEHAAVVALAAASPDVAVTLRVLAALGTWTRTGLDLAQPMPAAKAARAAPILAALLDHEDPLVVERAATLCAQVVPAAPDTPLAATVVERALAALQKAPTKLGVQAVRIVWCASGPPREGLPRTRDSWLVFAACGTGEARLLAPLLKALRGHVDVAGKLKVAPETAANVELLLLCLARLAPHLDAAGARQAFELLAPAFVARPPQPFDGGAQRHVRRALAAVLPSLPANLVEWYVALEAHERRGLLWMAERADRLDEALVERMIGTGEQELWRALRDTPEVFFGAPARLVAAWRTAGQLHEAAEHATARMWGHDPDAVVALVARGALPRGLVATAMDTTKASLAHVAAVLPAPEDRPAGVATPFSRFVWAIEHVASAGTAAGDLAVLRTLAASPLVDVALAAARRAAAGGDEGRALAKAAIERLLRDGAADDDVARALRLAVELRLEPADLPPVLARLRAARNWWPRAVADAAAMRFLGEDSRRCARGSVARALALAGVDVELDVLRDVVAAADGTMTWGTALGGFLRCSPATTRAALQLAGERERWGGDLQRQVAPCTLHSDPGVRAAAHRALATRDAALWPCAWLVHEAAFDPDPAVRR